MLMSEAVDTVRSTLTGSMIDEITVLAAPYDPEADSNITLRYAKRSIAAGSVLSVGLNTFVAVDVSTDGTVVEVLPSMDGGPNEAADQGAIVRIRPHFTTWAIFREIVGEIQAMSSPEVGLYSPLIFQSDGLNWVDGTYFIDLDEVAPGRSITRLLMAEFKIRGSDAWQRFAEAEWQTSGGVVRVTTDPAFAEEYAFTVATTFGTPTALTTDLSTDCGISDALADIPILGAASMMALGWEGRRVQPVSQGDTRRPSEVGPGVNGSLSRQFRLRQQERINEEVSALTGRYGYRSSIASGISSGGWSRW